jgi:peptide/nickel transport system substrate-binding protein
LAQTTIRVGVSARDLGSLDPATGIGNGDEFPIRQIFNVLVGPKDGTSDLMLDHLQGELAEKWEMAPDARSFTFHLRHPQSVLVCLRPGAAFRWLHGLQEGGDPTGG